MASASGATSLALALQGGGAHGAFTWGVLDRLLADEGIRIEAISGTSAGAMNAVVLADGLQRGGRAGAQAALARFWRDISAAARWSPFRRTPLDVLLGRWNLDASPGVIVFDLLSRLFSPYDVNPLNLNPLRDFLAREVDFAAVRACQDLKLFVAATNVRTGQAKVFRNAELSADAVMASACLPFLYQAVEIDGEAYWDGGYMGNPVLYPIVSECETPDLVIVQINPIQRREVPRAARDILNRLNEITFNASLVKELRSIALLRALVDEESLNRARFREMYLHRIQNERELRRLGVSSKLNAEWPFLRHLHAVGWRTTDAWLAANRARLGRESSFDIAAVSDIREILDPGGLEA
jgi:NTE family protein